ncbi:MAG: TatA/E family twin arginine-targeting protein translocase [Dehalococcoidia bacterium]|nr:TatA/E family twin arginine-targeting protein translocase [Dehalococcoidia bacterium]
MSAFGIGVPELIIIMVIALVVFGPGKLPEIGSGLGKAIREFRKTSAEITSEFTREMGLHDKGQPASKSESNETVNQNTSESNETANQSKPL